MALTPEKLTVAQPVKRFLAFLETRNFITVFITARHWIPLSQMKPIHTKFL